MTNDLQEIKKRIYKQDKIEDVLEKLGCEEIRLKHDIWYARLPDGDNNRAVQVKDEERLITNIRTRNISGDIFTLISYIQTKGEGQLNKHLPIAREWVCKQLGFYDFLDGTYKPPKEHNVWLKGLKKKRKKKVDLNEIKINPILDETKIKKEYIMKPHVEWFNEGISLRIQRLFEVGYDPLTNRIVTMIRNVNGELIGVKGRTLDPDYKELEIPKYLYLHKFDKSLEWFNMHRALPHITERGYCLIFEGYKSVMKATQYGYPNSISIEGDQISEVQIAMLKDLGIGIEFIFCLDKDVPVKVVLDYARRISMRNVYGVFDLDILTRKKKIKEDGLLNKKDSPVDKGKEVFEQLLGRKVLLSS